MVKCPFCTKKAGCYPDDCEYVVGYGDDTIEWHGDFGIIHEIQQAASELYWDEDGQHDKLFAGIPFWKGVSPAQFAQYDENLGSIISEDHIGETTLVYGVPACYHNHTGNTGETLEETEQLLALTDPAKFFGFLDTGHATKDFVGHSAEKRAAMSPERNWDRIDFLEFKDWSEEHDLCTEVGAGVCDYEAVFRILKEKAIRAGSQSSRTVQWVTRRLWSAQGRAGISSEGDWAYDQDQQTTAWKDGSGSNRGRPGWMLHM